MAGRLLLRAAAALALLTAPGTAGKAATPRFKWGQTKELLFLSVMVRGLDAGSVQVGLPTPGDLRFSAAGSDGEESLLELPLREDVKPDSLKWEVSARPDKWGTAVLITLAKHNEHRWDLLVTDPKRFKGVMDRDWTREDQSLEPEEEVPYLDDHEGYLAPLTEKNLNKTLGKFGAVVVNVRYPWCSQCKSHDDTFAKAAKVAKGRGKKDKAWKRVAFVVLDAREQRGLARRFGARCDFTCDYRVLTGADEEPMTIKSRWSDAELLGDVSKFLSPAVEFVKSADEAKTSKNTTCVGSFASEASPRYLLFKRVAGIMRGELVFMAALGAEGSVEVRPLGQDSPHLYDGSWDDNGTAFLDWLRPRSLPLLQEYTWQLREPYERLGLPAAKVWIDDKGEDAANKIVRHIVRRVAKKFVGRLAFLEQQKSTYSYELRDYGLNQPEVYPAFGIASNISYNSVKYGFEVAADSYVAELFEGTHPSVEGFWREPDKAVEALSRFCERVLSGAHPEAHETGAPQANWSAGQLKRLVWKTYGEVRSPESPMLLEVFGKYRAENNKKLKEAENLAAALEGAFVVASYDTADNFLPPGDFKREKYSSDTEWYWVPRQEPGSERLPIRKLTKPKKDAPIKKVLEFLKKQSGADVDVPSLTARFEELMKSNPPPAAPSPVIDPELEEDLPEPISADGGLLGGMDLGKLPNTGEPVQAGESMFGSKGGEL